jgi:integrase
MKKPDNFPYEHTASGMVFQIYFAPLERTDKEGKTTKYDSFLVKYHMGGKLAQKRKSNWEDIETHIEEVVAAQRKSDPERLELSGRDRRIYLAAVEAVTPLKRDVDDVAREFVAATQKLAPHGLGVPEAAQMLDDALKKLGKTALSTAVDFFKRHGETMTGIRTVAQVRDELISDLEKDKRGKYHIRDMKIRLNRFCESFTGPIQEVEEVAITGWLQNLEKLQVKDGKRSKQEKVELVSARTRNNYRAAVAELFTFAKKRGYLPRDLPTATDGTARVKVVPGKNHIISPEEANRVLESVPPYLIPFTVLKLFSGLRTEEAFGLSWEELRFNSKAVIIEAKLAKLRQRRVPPILPNLAKWLQPFRNMKGPINPGYASPQCVQNAVIRESKKVGVTLKRNTFRNCYISYRVAVPTASAIVAAEAGTSARMIESNYKELATKQEAKAWFSIRPKASQLRALRKWANNAARTVNGS